jgi:hypothetical protein
VPKIKEWEWKNDKQFAILALAVGKHEDNIRHRIDLVRIEEGYENLEKLLKENKIEEKTFIIGLDNQQYQAQIETSPKK